MAEKKYNVFVLEDKEELIQEMLKDEFFISAVCFNQEEGIHFSENKPIFLIWDMTRSKIDAKHLMEESSIYEVPLLIITDSQENPMLADLKGIPLTMIVVTPFTKEELCAKVQEFLKQVIKWQLERIAGPFIYRGRKLVLVADEDSVIGTEVQTYLKDWYDVVQVRSGHAALEFMEYQVPDVLLADMEMEIHHELRKREHLKGVPFFYLTYDRDRITILRVTSAGAKGCIVKPIQKEELLIKLKEVLGTPVKEREQAKQGNFYEEIAGKTGENGRTFLDYGKQDKPHILVVDDFSMALKTMKVQLEGEYQVTLAISGKQALAFLEKHHPDLIFMDVEMPEMNGIETVKKIKENPLWREIPIIFLTGNKEKDTIYSCMNLGAVDYLIKPVSVLKMQEKIQKVLGIG